MYLLIHRACRRSIVSSNTFSRRCLSIAKNIVPKPEVLTVEEQLFKKHEDNVYYSEYWERIQNKGGYKKNAIATKILAKQARATFMQMEHEPLPVSLKYLQKPLVKFDEIAKEPIEKEDIRKPHVHFPFQQINVTIQHTDNADCTPTITPAKDTNLEIRTRLELLNKPNSHLKWMNDYENFPLVEEVNDEVSTTTEINYGTPDTSVPTSNVPCGGCGALLHCRDSSIPGYIPSEIYLQYQKKGGINLEGIHCQRCHFLEHYNMALQVQVAPEDYPKVLHCINQQKHALVILVVDLLDFPCSIWPGLTDLIGHGRPIVVVGNKVDLLPDDGKGYLKRVQDHLAKSMKENGFAMTNIKHVELISAKTGFGIEDLITKLHSLWQYKGDVYIVGCTNVGKSTLFNALLQSDYCKDAADDLLQRATTSPWPGTTLNLLKFPILRPSGWRLHVRFKRLLSARRIVTQENTLRQKAYRKTRDPKYAALIGHIERTRTTCERSTEHGVASSDAFAVHMQGNADQPMGLNMKDKRFALSKWCYDTPGVVQPEQFIHQLTTDELVRLFPETRIRARTFCLAPGASLLIGGVARVDYLTSDGNNRAPCRFTVFASHQLPVTVCATHAVAALYDDLLRTAALGVPMNDTERLRLWPGLSASQRHFSVTGIDHDFSCADLVLSSAGWVAITPDTGRHCVLQAWTPEARGIHLRDPLLPNVVRYRGRKLRHNCAYNANY